MELKPIFWVGSAKDDLISLPEVFKMRLDMLSIRPKEEGKMIRQSHLRALEAQQFWKLLKTIEVVLIGQCIQ